MSGEAGDPDRKMEQHRPSAEVRRSKGLWPSYLAADQCSKTKARREQLAEGSAREPSAMCLLKELGRGSPIPSHKLLGTVLP